MGDLSTKPDNYLGIDFASLSHTGNRRDNQDCADSFVDRQAGLYCFVLADGLGGHKAGQTAARIAVETLLRCLRTAADGAVAHAIIRGLGEANDLIKHRAAADPELDGMKTTCSVAVILGSSAYLVSVGDSRVYLFRQGNLVFRSRDDSVVQMLVDMGEIRPEEALDHPDRNRILKALGVEGEFRLSQNPHYEPLMRGDRILLCSDGFWEYFSDLELAKSFGPPQETARPESILEDMFRVARKRAEQGKRKQDNITAQLVMVS